MMAPVVRVSEGQLRGKVSQDFLGGRFFSFLGIPYGAPPTGKHRFQPPRSAEPWQGVKDATKEGNECPSRHVLFYYIIGSEKDCLNLNVFTKELPDQQKNKPLKPVMVWIHGGGFVYGNNKSEMYGPDFLMTEDIVLVVINYRLGVLGFLSLEDETLGVPGNAGLKDMVLALKWVQRNIHNFMGDPNNVTIFGESAGSAAVHYLLVSPMAAGLFHKAIMQSGVALNSWAKGAYNGRGIAKYLNIDEMQADNEQEILNHLLTLSTNDIIVAQHKIVDTFCADHIRIFGPVTEKPSEGAFLSEEPEEVLRKGTFNKVPVIMGYTSLEGMLFVIVQKILPHVYITSDFQTEIHHELNLPKNSPKSLEVAEKIRKYYFGDETPSLKNLDRLLLLKSDNLFMHSIHRAIEFQKRHSSMPIYMYRFTVDEQFNFHKGISTYKHTRIQFFFLYLTFKISNSFMKVVGSLPKTPYTGVCHADDLGYLFKCFMHPPRMDANSKEGRIIQRLVRMWTNFARTGRPTATLRPDRGLVDVDWRPVTISQNHFLEIGSELKMGVDPDAERMKFWNDIYNDLSR